MPDNPDKNFFQFSRAALDAGFPHEQIKEIADEKPDEDGGKKFEALTKDTSPEFKEELLPEYIEAFIALMGKDKDVREGDLVALGNFLRQFGSREYEPRILTAEEKRIIVLGIKYLESWVYSGKLGDRTSSENNFSKNYYFAVGTFLINQMAKICELPENADLEGLSKKKASDFILKKVLIFSKELFGKEEIEAEIQGKVAEIDKLKKKLYQIKHQMDGSFNAQALIFGKIKADMATSIEEIRLMDTQNAAALADLFEKVSSNPKILKKLLIDNVSFFEAWAKESEADMDLRDDLQSVSRIFENQQSEFSDKIAFLVKKYEKFSKEYKKEQSLIDESGYVVNEIEIQSDIDHLEQSKQRLSDLLLNRDSREEEFNESMVETFSSVWNQPGGSMYLMKNIIVATEMIRRRQNKSEDPLVDLTTALDERRKGLEVFSFNEEDSELERSAYYKVHIEKGQLPFALVAAHYIIQKKQKK